MTNSVNAFLVMVFITWSTNTVDTLLTPVGDEILRSKIVMRTDVYTIPGMESVTNKIAVATNTTQLTMQWIEMPPVPAHPVINGPFQGWIPGNTITNVPILKGQSIILTNGPPGGTIYYNGK